MKAPLKYKTPSLFSLLLLLLRGEGGGGGGMAAIPGLVLDCLFRGGEAEGVGFKGWNGFSLGQLDKAVFGYSIPLIKSFE